MAPKEKRTVSNNGIITANDLDVTGVSIADTNTTITLEPTKPRIICICGFAETTREQANREPKDVEIWSLNRCYTFLKRWDRWFEVHEAELYTGKSGLRESDYLDRIKASGVPVYMQHPDDDIPNAVQYPLQPIITQWRDYFTTSIAYMLALVAWEHINGQPVAEMHMCGVDMSAFSEYSEQRPCVEYWCGILDGLGIKVIIPVGSPVLKCAMSYGRHSERVLQVQAKERMEFLKVKQGQTAANVQALMGASAEYNHVFESLEGFKAGLDDDTIAKLDGLVSGLKDRRKELVTAQTQQNAELNACLGAARECQHWLTAVAAPQTMEQEPDSVQLPKV